MSCPVCGSSLGCDVDCSDAPWNWDLPKTTKLGYLKRMVKWLRDECHCPIPLNFHPNYRFSK